MKHNSGCLVRAARRGGGLVIATGLVLALGVAGPAGARAAGTRICESSSHPALAARLSSGILAALRGRSSAVGLQVVDRRRACSTSSTWPRWGRPSWVPAATGA